MHQVELESQNEGLRRIQVELASSRDRFIDLYDFAPVGCFTLADLLVDLHDTAIVHTIVELGRNLDPTVTAKRVETQAQRDLLADCGCHAFHANLSGRPCPAGALCEAARRSVRAQMSSMTPEAAAATGKLGPGPDG